jgi:hypothetical protein
VGDAGPPLPGAACPVRPFLEEVSVMRSVVPALLLVGLALGPGAPVTAQQQAPQDAAQPQKKAQRASPREEATANVAGAHITVEYGRPFMKGREIFGGLVPHDKVWRTGADEATILTTDRALVFGTLEVPAGTYSLYTIPGEARWELIVNRQTGQWGTRYDEAQDLGRVPMTVTRLDSPVEQFTIEIGASNDGGELRFEWAQTRATAPFKVR